MGKKTKIVLDTNILISSLLSLGPPYDIVHLALNRELQLCISKEQLTELHRVLAYKKLNLSLEKQDKFFSEIITVATIVDITNGVDVIQDDPADNVIVETALVADALLITGDKHILSIRNELTCEVYTAKKFVDELKYL